jgi:hypothetical protein
MEYVERAGPPLIAVMIGAVHAADMSGSRACDSVAAMMLLACTLHLLSEVGLSAAAWLLMAPVIVAYGSAPALTYYYK